MLLLKLSHLGYQLKLDNLKFYFVLISNSLVFHGFLDKYFFFFFASLGHNHSFDTIKRFVCETVFLFSELYFVHQKVIIFIGKLYIENKEENLLIAEIIKKIRHLIGKNNSNKDNLSN